MSLLLLDAMKATERLYDSSVRAFKNSSFRKEEAVMSDTDNLAEETALLRLLVGGTNDRVPTYNYNSDDEEEFQEISSQDLVTLIQQRLKEKKAEELEKKAEVLKARAAEEDQKSKERVDEKRAAVVNAKLEFETAKADESDQLKKRDDAHELLESSKMVVTMLRQEHARVMDTANSLHAKIVALERQEGGTGNVTGGRNESEGNNSTTAAEVANVSTSPAATNSTESL